MDSENSTSAYQHLPLPVCIVQPGSGTIRSANPAFAEMCGETFSDGMTRIGTLFPVFDEDRLEYISSSLEHSASLRLSVEKLPVKKAPGVYDAICSREPGGDICLVFYRQTDFSISDDEEKHMQALIMQAPVPTAVYLGPDMIIHLANDAMLSLWGKQKNVVGMHLRKALPELEGQPFFDLLKNVYETGTIYQTEEDRGDLIVDGRLQTFYFNFTYKPLFDAEGNVYGILNMAVDVTSHVMTKRDLVVEREHNHLALEAGDLGTWVLYPEKNTVEWDSRCQRMFGFSEFDHINYDGVLAHIHPADREKVDEAVRKALDPESGGKYLCEFRTIGARDKKLRYLRCQGRAYFTRENKPYRFAGTAQDLSLELEQRMDREKMLALIQNSSDYMAVANEHGQLTYINQAGRDLMGIPEGTDITKLTSADFYDEAFFREKMHAIYSGLKNGGHWKGMVNFRHFVTGEIIPAQADFIGVTDPMTGEIIGRAGTVRDLRPELAAKKALFESERLLRNITTEAPTALWMTDAQGAIIYVNQTWVDWTGFSFSHPKDSAWAAAIVEEEKGRVTSEFFRVHDQRLPYEVEFRIRRKDGRIRWILARGNAQFDEENNFTGYIGSATDITDTIETEKRLQITNDQLRQQIRQFAFVTDAMPQIVWATQPDGYHDFFNRRWYSFTGLSYEETKNTGWSNVLHPDDYARTLEVWSESLKTGKPYEIEYRMRRFDGEYRWLLARALPQFDEEGRIIKWFGTCTDIHEQKMLERQKDDFLGIASHELRTPVTSIKAYAQVLESVLTKKGEEKEAQMAAKMNGQINRLTNLIADLLDVTKINSGRMQFNKTHFAFNEMVRDTIEELQRTSHHHTLIADFGTETFVFGDRERIGQVITNMVINAVKYSPDSDKIIIHTALKNNEVELCVEDFGVGIAADKQQRVFEQFYRVSGDMQHTFPGLGLGLYISAEIVKREGGRIWLTSEENKGSSFCFSIPVDGRNLEKEIHI
ncbi:MAG: PAS domain-containing protein [Mucilaginibacter polytrichastri]|nr:PAS domain-containing protein [Mucilaginibacter polytrichastri]